MESKQKETIKMCPNPHCEFNGIDVSHKVDSDEYDCPKCGATPLRELELPAHIPGQDRDKICLICLEKAPESIIEKLQGDGLFDQMNCPFCKTTGFLRYSHEVDHDAK